MVAIASHLSLEQANVIRLVKRFTSKKEGLFVIDLNLNSLITAKPVRVGKRLQSYQILTMYLPL